jgi:hypothetical protein
MGSLNSMTHVLIAGIIIGLNLLAGFMLLYRNWRFVNNALTTNGVVIGLRRRGSTKSGRALYSPVVSFVAADGSRVEFTEPIRRHPPGFEVGERVEVMYDRRNFKRARVPKSRWDLYFPAWIFLLVGGVLLFFGMLLAAVFAVATLLVGPMQTP